MTRYPISLSWLGATVLLAACGGSTEPGPASLDCSQESPTALAAGEHVVIDASKHPCVRLPAAGSAGAEYIYVALSADGDETTDGVTADYDLSGSAPGAAGRASAIRAAHAAGPAGGGPAAAFHAMLRSRERALSRRTGGAALDRGAAARTPATPPSLGDQRTFDVCSTTDCTDFVQSTATAKVIGQRVAIYLDDNVPSGGYTQSDLDRVGSLFDSQLYPIDTTAFGRESDLDNNGVVIVLLTPRVNELTPNCNQTGSVILGYFFGLDLLPSQAHSNDGEIFYGLVPDPGNSTCDISKNFATSFLPPVFIHEFQHMISFNQHVLVRGGSSEVTWLNEGLSHFAEELGGRLIPDANCQPEFASCEDQFLINGDVSNAYAYLSDTESNFLVEPDNSTGTLAERGANWLFVRWLADHFAATQPSGTELTRSLVQTRNTGVTNVEAVTSAAFPTLIGQWQLANYLDNLPGFAAGSDRLQYTSIDFRALFQAGFDAGQFSDPYPLVPDVAGAGTYSRTGTLRGGSGRHVDIVQDPSAGGESFRLTNHGGTSALPASVTPRVALARIR